jgi:hypothetical protein
VSIDYDPRQPPPEERAFQDAQKYMPAQNLDAGWHRSAETSFPWTWAIIKHTAFLWIGALAAYAIARAFISQSGEGNKLFGLILYAAAFVLAALGIAMPVKSFLMLNWLGKLAWMYLVDQLGVLLIGPTVKGGMIQPLIFAVLGSALSEFFDRAWHSYENASVVTYRIRPYTSKLLIAAAILIPLHWGYVWLSRPATPQTELSRTIPAPSPQPATETQPGQPENSTPVPGQQEPEPARPAQPPPLPTPDRKPDHQVTFSGQPSTEGPAIVSQIFEDISFESGDEPQPGLRGRVADSILTGKLRPDERLNQSNPDDAMWPSNVAIATTQATRRLQGLGVAGMECRLWVLDYSIQLRDSVLWVHNARVQADCRR